MIKFLHLVFNSLIIYGVILQNVYCDAPLVDSASLPLEHRGLYGPPAASLGSLGSLGGTHLQLPAGLSGIGGGGGGGIGPDDPWPLATPDMPQIKNLQVQCEKTHMRVNIEFDRPFYGMIFSKGFYSDSHCVHLKPGTGHLSATFEIFLNSCGMSSSANHNAVAGNYGHGNSPTPSGSYVENTIIIQYDPYVQEVWDQARKLRCTWYDFYEKAVTFRPFQVDMLHAVTANFLGDNLQCWMQIQVGKGPWASEVSGIVKIGQTMTMVLAIKDDENKFDMLVRNCVAHDGKRAPIQLVDQYGCVVRPKIMSKFQKIKNFGPSASVVSFAYFQAFKFPDSMNVHFQCVIQVCRYNCPEPKCAGHGFGLVGEYGPPPPLAGNSLGTGEYGPPPVANEYGGGEYNFPQGYPDPRHPSGPTGAYSEPNENVVPAPQAQISQSSDSKDSKSSSSSDSNTPNPNQQQQTTAEGQSGSSSSSSSNSGSSAQRQEQQQQHDHQQNSQERINNNEIHLPPPPPPGHHGQYNTVQRKSGLADELLDSHGGNLATLGGRPRSVENLSEELRGARRRRHSNEPYETMTIVVNRVYSRERRETAQEMTDVNTSRTIQVVAPGDVNFALNSAPNNETVVIQSASSNVNDSETICMSLPSFVAGLVMLLLVLIVASLVAAFLFIRVRAIDRKGAVTTFVNARPYDNAEFVKVTN